MSTDFSIDEEHPLALELRSLHIAVHRYQHEASTAAVKLQRHSLDTSHALERTQALERENARLLEELDVLRAHSVVTPHPITLQELTNALRHVSDKLSVTEETLMKRTTELMSAFGELAKTKAQLDDLSFRTRTREEESRSRERHLQNSLRAAREENKMADLVVQEYADLVRSLTSKSSASNDITSTFNGKFNGPTPTLIDSLSEGKSILHRLLDEFNAETHNLEAEISRLNSELVIVQSKLQGEQDTATLDRVRLAELQVALDKLRVDDDTAAKMVSRYMKFSQSSNNSLSNALENLKTRHKATTTTLTAQIDYLQRCLFNEKRGSEKLRFALDELSEDISRETYGRRREISLRLAFLGREENLAENFRRWYRKAIESYQRVASSEEIQHVLSTFKLAVEEANGLLDTLNGQPALEDLSPGALARILAAQDAVNILVRELQIETDKRMGLERQLAHVQEALPPLPLRVPADPSPIDPVRSQVSTPSSPVRPERPSSPKISEFHQILDKVSTGELVDSKIQIPIEVKVGSSQQPVTLVVCPELPIHRPSPRLPEATIPSPTTLSEETAESPTSITDSASLLGQNELSIEDTSVPNYSPLSSSTDEETQLSRQHLLRELAKVRTRYDDLQRAFRGCHLALKDLTKSLTSSPQNDTVNLVHIAVERLDDFNEDARVELEIRAADEERTTKTFETLLRVHGAIESETQFAEIEHDVQAFVDGTETSVARTIQQFSRKLDDLTHDIASIKSFLHELSAQDQNPSRSPTPWSSLAAGILGTTSRPASPSPTFGSVMTSSRLRHASSFTKTRMASFGEMQDPLSGLNLRIPMPSQTYTPPATLKNTPARLRTTSMMNIFGLGPRANLLNSPNATPPRIRKVSLAYSSVGDENTSDREDTQNDVE